MESFFLEQLALQRGRTKRSSIDLRVPDTDPRCASMARMIGARRNKRLCKSPLRCDRSTNFAERARRGRTGSGVTRKPPARVSRPNSSMSASRRTGSPEFFGMHDAGSGLRQACLERHSRRLARRWWEWEVHRGAVQPRPARRSAGASGARLPFGRKATRPTRRRLPIPATKAHARWANSEAILTYFGDTALQRLAMMQIHRRNRLAE